MQVFQRFVLPSLMLLAAFELQALDFFEDKDVYWNQGRNVYFKYDEQDSSVTGSNEHPAKLDDKDIRNALESLQIWERDELDLNEDFEPVFTIKQAALLGQYLSRGFRNAKPDQDILFALDKRVDKLFGLKTSVTYTAGRAFVKDGKLNIIIGDYNKPRQEGYEKAYDPTEIGIVAYHFLHGSRTSKQKFDENTIKVEGVDNKVVKKRIRKDWFIIDTKTAAETYLALKKEKENPKDAQDKQFEAEAAKLAREQRQMRLEMARMRKEMKEGSGAAPAALTVEQRLENLEKVYNKGLISDDEYASKREQILSDL